MPYHSILIAAYNRFDYLRNTIYSCLSSTDPDLEIVITDDGSEVDLANDFYSDIKRLDPRIRILRSNDNLGIGFRLAQLHDIARGRLLHVIGSDDMCHPRRLEITKRFMENYGKKSSIFCTPAIHLDYIYRKIPNQNAFIHPLAMKACMFFQPLVLHPTICTWHPDISGLKPYRKDIRSAVDYCYYVDNYSNSDFISVNQSLTYLVHSSTGITRNLSSRSNQLHNHDVAMHALWSKFVNCSFDDVSTIRRVAVAGDPGVTTTISIEGSQQLLGLLNSLKAVILNSVQNYQSVDFIEPFLGSEENRIIYVRYIIESFSRVALYFDQNSRQGTF